MKKLVILFIVFCATWTSHAQFFSKERITNLENFDKRPWSFGFFLGLNQFDFNFDYFPEMEEDIQTNKSMGFNVGLVTNMRISDYFDLRLEPGIDFSSRELVYPGNLSDPDKYRDVTSTYIHIPLLLKFSAKRQNNFRPFVIGGLSYSRNLSSNEANPDDNSAGQFRMKTNTYWYEVGIGIDLYLYYFKFSPSLRGVFAINNELVYDDDLTSIYTSGIDRMMSQGLFLNFTFQ